MKSHLEEELARQMALAGLPEPVREFRAFPPKRFRWDFAYPDIKLLIEVHGGTFAKTKLGHNTGVGIGRDLAKLNIATLNGWSVLAFDNRMVTSGDALLVIEEFLLQKGKFT